MKNDRTYLLHIQKAIATVESYLAGVSREQFLGSEMLIDAVVRQLEIIGEASGKLSRRYRHLHTEVRWRRLKEMRNFLIHEYFGVNAKVVWDTCWNDLPAVKGRIEALLGK